MADMKPRSTLCVEAAGSHVAGHVLYRIAFWSRLVKIETADGQKWVVNSTEKWMFDTGCSHQQLKDSFARLRARGLIKTEKHLFKRKTHAFVQLTAKGHLALTGEGQEALTGKGLETPTYIKGVLEESSEGSSNDGVLTHPVIDPANSEKTSTGKEVGNMKGMKSVNDLPSLGNAKAILLKPDKLAALAIFWKQKLHEVTGTFAQDLSPKELGQLANFVKQCPRGKAGEVVEFALSDWVYFAKKAGTMAGTKTIPTTPTVLFLLQHRAQAVMLWSPPAKKRKAPKAICVDAIVQLPAQKAPEAPTPVMTDEELWAEPDMTEED